jgi:hypothetical protein
MASKSAAQRWLQRWQGNGAHAAVQAQIFGTAEEHGIIQWPYGAIVGAFFPLAQAAVRTWPVVAKARVSSPQPSGRGRQAPGEPHDARQR